VQGPTPFVCPKPYMFSMRVGVAYY
jgi:hypothetical protein